MRGSDYSVRLDQRREELSTLLPTKVLEEVSKLVSRVQSIQHTKVKEQLTLQARNISNRTDPLSWIEKHDASLSNLLREK